MVTLPRPSYPHISTRPEVMSGRPCISGTRVRVMDVVAAKLAGVPEDELLDYFSSRPLTLGEVYAALVYYYDHQDEIDRALEADAELGQQAEEERARTNR